MFYMWTSGIWDQKNIFSNYVCEVRLITVACICSTLCVYKQEWKNIWLIVVICWAVHNSSIQKTTGGRESADELKSAINRILFFAGFVFGLPRTSWNKNHSMNKWHELHAGCTCGWYRETDNLVNSCSHVRIPMIMKISESVFEALGKETCQMVMVPFCVNINFWLKIVFSSHKWRHFHHKLMQGRHKLVQRNSAEHWKWSVWRWEQRI